MMDARLGIEPRITESKSGVLPITLSGKKSKITFGNGGGGGIRT